MIKNRTTRPNVFVVPMLLAVAIGVLFVLPEFLPADNGTPVFLQEQQEDSEKDAPSEGEVKTVTFRTEASEGAEVLLVGDFNDWQADTMEEVEPGVYRIEKQVKRGQTYQYAYMVNGEWKLDESAPRTENGEFSRLTVEGSDSSTDRSGSTPENNANQGAESDDGAAPSSGEEESGEGDSGTDPDGEDASTPADGTGHEMFARIMDRIDRLEGRLEEMNQTLQEYRSRLMSKDAEISNLRDRLQREREDRLRLEEKLVQAQADADRYQEDYEELQSQNESLRLQVEELSSENEELKQQISELEQQNEELRLEQQEEGPGVQALQEENENLREENQELREQLTQLQNEQEGNQAENSDESETDEPSGAENGDSSESGSESESSDSRQEQSESRPESTYPPEYHEGRIQYVYPDVGENGTVVVNLHEDHSLQVGHRLIVVYEDNVLGEVEVTEVVSEDNYSTAVPVDEDLILEVQEGDTVITRPRDSESNSGSEEPRETGNGEDS